VGPFTQTAETRARRAARKGGELRKCALSALPRDDMIEPCRVTDRELDGGKGLIEFEQQAMPMAEAIGVGRRRARKRHKGKPSCVECFFHCQMLCALDLDEPCSTFRPNTDDGLVPPRQPSLLLRQGPEEEAAKAA
jgi:hypothetical protein